jgi:hypothetical protein
MAQFRKDTQQFLADGTTMFEVVMMTDSNGHFYSMNNRLPVTLGSDTITIAGNVNILDIVTVNSTPSNPVHVHTTEVGTSGILNVPYMPIQGNVFVQSIVNTNVLLLNTANNYSLGGYINVNNLPVTQNVSFTNQTVSVVNTANVYLSEGHANVTVVANNASPVLVKYADSVQLDTTSRLRTGAIQSQFWYAPLVDADGDWRFSYYVNGNNANVIFIANTSETQLNSGTSSGGSVIKQSRIRYKIIPGGSHQAYFTVNWNSNSTTSSTVTKRVGLFDSNNGIFWENTDNTLAIVVRRMLANGYITEDRTYSNTFNTDKLDGSGASGFNIFTAGLDKQYTFWFDFTGGRTGRIRFGLGTTAGATIAHTQNYAGAVSTNFITDNSLPVRKEIFNTASQSVNAYFVSTGSVFQYEEPRSYNPFLATGNHLTGHIPGTTLRPIMTIGLRDVWPYNKADITFQDFHIFDTENQSGKLNAYPALFYYELIYNANVNSTYAYNGNGAILSANTGKASHYYNWSNTAVLAGGAVLKNGLFLSGQGTDVLQGIPETFNLGTDVNGHPDTITIAAKVVSAGYVASNLVATAGWLEQL